MKIYIDFDGTLFDSTKHNNIFKDLFSKYNVSNNYLEKVMELDYEHDKNLDHLANKIILDNNLDDKILSELDGIYNESLAFDDAITFLEKYYQKYDLILLTLGNYDYQLKKIKCLNINKYFKDIIITEKDKSKLDINYSDGIFIDNNPEEIRRFYKSGAKYLIRMKRVSDKYSCMDLNLKDVKEFENFNELINSKYIEKIGE